MFFILNNKSLNWNFSCWKIALVSFLWKLISQLLLSLSTPYRYGLCFKMFREFIFEGYKKKFQDFMKLQSKTYLSFWTILPIFWKQTKCQWVNGRYHGREIFWNRLGLFSEHIKSLDCISEVQLCLCFPAF